MARRREEADEYERATAALWEAECLLVVAGPRFYEDSSRTPLADPLCDPALLQSDPNRFYGFWGSFHNRYADAAPHDGYAILRKWRENYFDARNPDQRKRQVAPKPSRSPAPEDEVPVPEDEGQRCFVVTATVDGSFGRVGFREAEVYEVAGTLARWQCAAPCSPRVWALEAGFRFAVDAGTGRAPPIKYVDDTRPVRLVGAADPPSEGNGEGDDPFAWGRAAPTPPGGKAPPLHLADAIRVVVELQDPVPGRDALADPFTAAPASSHQRPLTYAFPDPAPMPDTPPVVPPVPAPKGPETPYMYPSRISHTLQHICALRFAKYATEEGLFQTAARGVDVQLRRKRWQQQHKFFDPALPDVTRSRQQRVFYCVSLAIHDTRRGTEWPLPPALAAALGGPVDPHHHHAPPANPDAPWEQGSGGRWYFSHLPVASTHSDPDEQWYDTVRLNFPYSEVEQIPRVGRVSLVVERCEYPETQTRLGSPGAGKRDRKKPDDETAAAPAEAAAAAAAVPRRLDPELVTCAAVHLIGRLGNNPTLKPVGFGSHSETQSVGRSTAVRTGHSAPSTSVPSGENDEPEDFEYLLQSGQGHVLRLGAAVSNPQAIKYLEVECPLPRRPRATPGARYPKAAAAPPEGPTSQPLAPKAATKRPPRPVANHPTCPACGGLARPAVVMGDARRDPSAVAPSRKPYAQWEAAVLKQLKAGGSLVILELGCERRVEAARRISERLYKAAAATHRVTHVRIGPEEDTGDRRGATPAAAAAAGDADHAIVIVDHVASALGHIDRSMNDMKRRK